MLIICFFWLVWSRQTMNKICDTGVLEGRSRWSWWQLGGFYLKVNSWPPLTYCSWWCEEIFHTKWVFICYDLRWRYMSLIMYMIFSFIMGVVILKKERCVRSNSRSIDGRFNCENKIFIEKLDDNLRKSRFMGQNCILKG